MRLSSHVMVASKGFLDMFVVVGNTLSHFIFSNLFCCQDLVVRTRKKMVFNVPVV